MHVRHAAIPAGIATLVLAVASPVAAQDSQTAQVEAAIAARQGDSRLDACLTSASAVRDFRTAQESLANVGNPKWAPKFNCSGIGASWQEVAPQACCSVFERDKGRNADAAWNALQSCGWRAKIEERRPAYLTAARACLGDAVPTAPVPPATTPRSATDPWRDVPTFNQIRGRIVGQDAFAVLGGSEWRIFDSAGRLRGLPGFLSDRVRPGYAVLDDRAWLQAALATFRQGMGVEVFVASMARGSEDASKHYLFFGDELLAHHLPNTSVRTVGGQFCSSEHATIRGTINGGGDFIYCPIFEQLRVPLGTEKRYWDGGGAEFLKRFLPPEVFEQLRRDVDTDIARLAPARPGIRSVAWRPLRAAARASLLPVTARLQTPSGTGRRIRIDLPTGTVTTDDPLPIVITDVAPSGAAAVTVLAGRVRVTETRTGRSTLATPGQAVLVWPDMGVSQPIRVSADRLGAAARPRMRGRVVLQPGERWAGTLRLHDLLTLEGRLLWDKPAGGAYALDVTINGTRLTGPLVNKTSPFRYADGRNFPYREPSTARWMLFYSPDYTANTGTAGGVYEVKTDPGQAYRYVWDIAALLGGNQTAQVEFRNTNNASKAAVELTLLPTDLYELTEFARRRDTTTAPTTALDEREPNDAESAAMPVAWGATVRAASTFTTAYQDRDHYQLDGGAPGRYTIRLTPGACPLWFNLPATGPSRTIAKPATITIERLGSSGGGTRVRTTLEVDGQAASTAESVKTGLPDRWLLAVQNETYSTRMDGNRRLVQCASGGPFAPEVPYTLALSRDGAPTAAAPGPTAPVAQPAAAGTGVVRGGDFGDPAAPTGRIFDLVTARGVEGGRPIGRTSEFLPGDNPIHVRFGLEGFAAGTILTSRWTYFPAAGPMVIGTGEFTVTPAVDYGTFSYELAQGKRWPAGSYQVEVMSGNAVLGGVRFSVAGQ